MNNPGLVLGFILRTKMNAHICRLTLPIILLARVAPPCSAERPSRDNLKHEAFDTDPGWESFRSRLLPEKRPLVRQDFGYRKSNFAGGAHTGEIGGVIFRDHDRAYYAKPIPTKTLDDRLSMSGKFSVTEADGSSALMIGWFHHEKSQGWRTPNSVAMRFDGNGGKHWIFFEYGTKDWGTHGMGAFEGIRYQETPTPPYKADGTVHEFSLTYDPKGADGNGQYTFTCDGKKWEMPALEIHREHGATFDRFGIWNQQTPGSVMEFYIDDLVVDGVVHSLDDDPGWIRDHNPVEYRQRAIRPFHDVGYSETNYAGDQKGEIGGIMFRDREPAYYGDKIGPLTRDDELYARRRAVREWQDRPAKRGSGQWSLSWLVQRPDQTGKQFASVHKTTKGLAWSGDRGSQPAGPCVPRCLFKLGTQTQSSDL
jgi:hypothetical protein